MTGKSNISRRTFVQGTTAAAASAAVVETPAFAALAPVHGMTAEHFAPHVGSGFRMVGDLGAVRLKLASVESVGRKSVTPSGVRDQAFELKFAVNDLPQRLSEGIYRIRHSELGTMDVTLVPCGDGACPSHLVALFN
ncbi:MAG: twin-arginine translocation signal domain-containing protein [Pseudomonadota bacterium]